MSLPSKSLAFLPLKKLKSKLKNHGSCFVFKKLTLSINIEVSQTYNLKLKIFFSYFFAKLSIIMSLEKPYTLFGFFMPYTKNFTITISRPHLKHKTIFAFMPTAISSKVLKALTFVCIIMFWSLTVVSLNCRLVENIIKNYKL